MAYRDIVNTPTVDRISGNFGTFVSTLTFAATATSGNLLTLIYRGNGSATQPTGWLVASTAEDTASSLITTLYYKVSDGSETSVDVQQSVSAGWWAQYTEYEGPWAASPLDVSSSQSNAPTFDGSLDLGPLTPTLTETLAIAVASHQNGTAIVNSIDESYTIDEQHFGNAGGSGASFIAHKNLGAIAETSPTVTWGGTPKAVGLLSVFGQTAVNSDPTLDTPIDDISVVETTTGTISDISTNFSDANLDTLTYSVSPALPSGMTLNTSTGVISGDGSLTITAAADYTFSASDGNGGTDATDVVSVEVTAPVMSVDSTSAGMQRGASFDVTFSNAATTPTTGNTSLASGGDTLTCTGVTGAGPYTATFTVGDLSKQVDGTGYVWTLTVDAETDNTSAIPLTIQADYTLVDLVDPVSSQGSMLEGYTGTAAVSGDHLEYDITSTLDSGVTVSVLATGEVNVSQAVDGDWVSNITIDRRVVQTDGTIGITATMTIQVGAGSPDTTKPVITLTGASVVTLSQGAAYTELGATWTDNVDGSGAAVVGGATVNVNTLGQYVVTYNYTDVAGNAGDQVIRTVNIVDTTIPVITLVGASTVSQEATLVYNDLGATASDNTDGDITSSIVVTSTVNTGLLGSYTVRYNVSDAAGNDAVEVVRTVNVVDTTIPTISLNGGSRKQVLLNGTYTELGATANDSYDGDITGSVVIAGDTVDETTLGTYVVTYNVVDSSANAAVQKTRSVEIVLELDTILPADRTSINRIAAALREAGTYNHKQTNDLVMEWLESEGITRGALNQMLYGYLGGLGYSGTIQDRMIAWSRDT